MCHTRQQNAEKVSSSLWTGGLQINSSERVYKDRIYSRCGLTVCPLDLFLCIRSLGKERSTDFPHISEGIKTASPSCMAFLQLRLPDYHHPFPKPSASQLTAPASQRIEGNERKSDPVSVWTCQCSKILRIETKETSQGPTILFL